MHIKFKTLLYLCSLIVPSVILLLIIIDPVIVLKGSFFLVFILLQIYIYQYLYTRPARVVKSKLIAILGILMALSVMFQCSPVFYPGIGLILSPFSSLPVSLGCILFPQGAPAMMIGAFLLISIISIEEAMIFVLATGVVGIAVSLVIISKQPLIKTICIPGLSLYSGILVLSYIIGVPGIKDFFAKENTIVIIFIVLIFSIIYSYLWILIVKMFLKVMMKLLR